MFTDYLYTKQLQECNSLSISLFCRILLPGPGKGLARTYLVLLRLLDSLLQNHWIQNDATDKYNCLCRRTLLLLTLSQLYTTVEIEVTNTL